MIVEEGEASFSCPVCGTPVPGWTCFADMEYPCLCCGTVLRVTARQEKSLLDFLTLPLPLDFFWFRAFGFLSFRVTAVAVVGDADPSFQRPPEWLAFVEMQKRAKAGDAASQFEMGRECELGQWIARNEAEALKWYEMSARQGYERAQQAAARMYFMGEGTAQDYEASYFWYRVAEKTSGTRDWTESVAKNLTPGQVAAMEKRAADWRPDTPKPAS